MPTLHQLLRNPRCKKKNSNKNNILNQGKFPSPQKKAICVRVYKQSPKKPNSANRAVAKIRLANGKTFVVKIGGEGHFLQEHSVVLVRGGGAKDLPAVRHYVIRGALDALEVPLRKQRRSKYGKSRPKSLPK